MKNILFLLSILLGQPFFCHSQRLGDFLTNMVAPLDKTEITSNFLWDKGLNGFAEPALFDGILRDSICIQPTAFGFLYAQARNAFVGTGVNPLPHPDVYMDFVKRHTGTDTIPLAALVLRYHRIHKDAVDSNLLSLQNEQLFDVPGRTQSPYLQDTLFAFAPLKTEAWHTTVHFTLPTELIWQNMGWADPLLQANFDDGQGWQILTAGQTYTIEYDSGGVKAIQTRIQQGSTILEAQSIIIVAEQPVQDRGEGPNYPLDPEDSISITGGGGDLRIFYGSPCNKLLKPFIIVEGFELVNNPPQFQKRLENLMGKPDVITGSSQPLGEWLYSQGYDIVWVNLFDIQDDIRDNAEVVKAALQKINEIKAANGSSEPNMIMGVSAGGIITKYMLAKTNSVPFDHQCEKFFSYDVPLRGANIPLAVQCLLHHVNYIATENDVDLLGSNPAAAGAFNALNSPFARQTLLYRFTYENGNEVLSSQEHEDFMAELDALGGIPIRHIALANGSTDNATRTNISEGSQLFNVNTLGTLLTFGWPLGFPYYIKVELHADGYALSNNPSSLVYDGNFSVIVNGVKLKEYALYVENERDKAYDTAPGGSSTLALSALSGLNGDIVDDIGIPWLPVLDRWVTMSNLSVTTYATHYCFIPTRSAISAGEGISLNGPFACGQGSSSRCTMSTEDTPLPGEYGVSTPEKNQDHVFLDARIGDVLVDELDAANLIPGGLLPSTLNTYYNAGLPVQSGIPTITIFTGSGQLSINNTGMVGYSNNNEPVSPANLFNAYTKCDAVIMVEDRAKLVVGADGGVKHGTLMVTEGSSVHIKSGGFLYVTSGQSKLLIKKGASLVLDAGAIVDVESYGSEIRIEGTLVINGDITFRGYGYFHFSNGGTLEFGPGVTNFKLTGRGFGHRFVRLSGGLSIEPNHGVIWKQGKMETNWGSLYINEGGRCLMDDVELAGPGIDVNQDYVGVTAMGAASLAFRRCEFKDYNTPVSSTLSNVHIFGACKFNDIQTGIIADGGGGGFWITDCTFEKYSWSGATISNRPTLTIGGSTWESESDSEYGLELHSVDQAVVKGSNFNGNGSNIPGPFSPSNGALDYHCGVFLDDVPLFVMRNSGMTFNPIGIVATNLMAGPSNVFLLNGSFIQRSQVGVYMDGTVTEGLVLMDCAALLHNDFGVFGTDVTLMIDAINAQQHPLDGGEPNTFLRDCTGGCGDLYFSLCYVAKIPALPIPMRENWWCVSDINTPQPAPATFMDIRSVACTVPVAVTTLPTAVRAPIACNTEEFTSATNLSGKGPEADCNVALSGGGTNGVGDAWHAAYQQLRLEDFEAAESGFQPVADLWSPDLSSYPSNCQLYIQVAKAIVDGTNGGDQLRPGGDRTTDLGKIVYANPNPTTGQLTVAFPDGPCMLRVFDPYGRLVHQAQAFGGTARLDASAWSVGIYTIEVFGADFREFVKVVVQR